VSAGVTKRGLSSLVASVFRAGRRSGRREQGRSQPQPRSNGRGRTSGGDIRISYTPDDDGQPDPGEVVWTWVPYEDDPSQGKDRPVVVVGTAGDRLAVVPVTSHDPAGRRDLSDHVSIGSGQWDREGRTSYADLGRILRVPGGEVRREGATLDRPAFDALVEALRALHPDIP
jgi:hypothetical protein